MSRIPTKSHLTLPPTAEEVARHVALGGSPSVIHPLLNPSIDHYPVAGDYKIIRRQGRYLVVHAETNRLVAKGGKVPYSFATRSAARKAIRKALS